jgi:hypothetical protein
VVEHIEYPRLKVLRLARTLADHMLPLCDNQVKFSLQALTLFRGLRFRVPPLDTACTVLIFRMHASPEFGQPPEELAGHMAAIKSGLAQAEHNYFNH